MQVNSMKPLGQAIKDYYEGVENVFYKIIRNDGKVEISPVSFYFRNPEEYYPAEREILDYCMGKVLVAGAGAGAHSLVLQDRGFQVTALDVSSENCLVLKSRGQKDVRCIDFIKFKGRLFDTVCLLGRNIGMAGSLKKLKIFMDHLGLLLARGGRVLFNSLDFRNSDDPYDVEYGRKNVKSGKYFGDITYRLEYKNFKGKSFNWLYIDFETLKNSVSKYGWKCELVSKDSDGGYSAVLTELID